MLKVSIGVTAHRKWLEFHYEDDDDGVNGDGDGAGGHGGQVGEEPEEVEKTKIKKSIKTAF